MTAKSQFGRVSIVLELGDRRDILAHSDSFPLDSVLTGQPHKRHALAGLMARAVEQATKDLDDLMLRFGCERTLEIIEAETPRKEQSP